MGYLAYVVIFCLALSEISSVRGRPARGAPQGDASDVTMLGAVGDGKTDDTKAFQSAWGAACQKTDGAKVTVPSGKTFLVSPIEFGGPCKAPTVTFEIFGTIVAPPKSQWASKKANVWINFKGVNGLSVVGNGQGSIDGRGDSWWRSSPGDNERPTALRFSACNNLQVSGLRHVNSQRNHVSITDCNHATFLGLHMTAPEDSPNTDGVDISSSTYVTIRNCTMATGDDCIAINGGTSNVYISQVDCGPGHGISVGSLGKDGEHDEVEGVSVDRCNFYRTTNGVRIKTWQGGSGFARNISFTGINFQEVSNSVIIDQFYCPHKQCSNKASAVQISDVRYGGLKGTSKGEDAIINIRCSNTVPCKNVRLEDVNIHPIGAHGDSPTAVCQNAQATISRVSSPTVKCNS